MTVLNLTALNQITRYGLLNGVWSPTGNWTFANTGLRLYDTGGDHSLNVKVNEKLTADRVLNLVTGDSDRTITLSGNPTLGDWFNQSVKTTASPTFVGLNLSSTQLIDLSADVIGQRIQATAGQTVNLQTWETSAGGILSYVDFQGCFAIQPIVTSAAPLIGLGVNPIQVGTGNVFALSFLSVTYNNTIAYVRGISGYNSIRSMYGGAAANITNLTGAYFYNSSNTDNVARVVNIASAYGVQIDQPLWTGSAGTTNVGTNTGLWINNQGTSSAPGGAAVVTINAYGIYLLDQSGATTLNYAIYTNAGDIRLMASAADKLGFHGAAPIAQQLLATGAGATVDNVITMLQNIGLCRQA